eukprot:15825-Pleurochrysis_carterae.AAC.2
MLRGTAGGLLKPPVHARARLCTSRCPSLRCCAYHSCGATRTHGVENTTIQTRGAAPTACKDRGSRARYKCVGSHLPHRHAGAPLY